MDTFPEPLGLEKANSHCRNLEKPQPPWAGFPKGKSFSFYFPFFLYKFPRENHTVVPVKEISNFESCKMIITNNIFQDSRESSLRQNVRFAKN